MATLGDLYYLEIIGGILELKKETKLDHAITCLDIGRIGDDPNHSEYAVLGTWEDRSVNILSLPELTIVTGEQLDAKCLPLCVLLCAIEGVFFPLSLQL